MTKKLIITYSMLFLFVFTFAFAFAFTLASSAQAEGAGCCEYEWCDDYPPTLGAQGHWVLFQKPEVHWECVFNGSHGCDTAWICPDPGGP